MNAGNMSAGAGQPVPDTQANQTREGRRYNTARTGKRRQEGQNMIAMTGELALDSWDRTSGEDNRGRTTLTIIGARLLGHDHWDRTALTIQSGQVGLIVQPC